MTTQNLDGKEEITVPIKSLIRETLTFVLRSDMQEIHLELRSMRAQIDDTR